MIISIAGYLGSGKSTLNRALAAHYGLKSYSAGGFLREFGQEQGLSIREISEVAKTDGGMIDFMLEERSRKLGESEDQFVMDGRLPFYVIPHSLSIFLTVSPEVSAERIYGDFRETESFASFEEAANDIRARITAEDIRYMKYYGIHLYDLSQYDVVIDAESNTAAQVLDTAISAIDAWQARGPYPVASAPEAYFRARQHFLGH
jgi:predicted cytidylate kinase